jgi:hypothetical protein
LIALNGIRVNANLRWLLARYRPDDQIAVRAFAATN